MTHIFVFVVVAMFLAIFAYFVYAIMVTKDRGGKQEQLQISSKDILAHVKILQKQKKYALVESVAQKYLLKQPDFAELRWQLSKAYFEQDKLYEAINEVTLILNAKPENTEVRNFMANCYKKINQKSKAISEYKEVLKIDPDNIKAVKELADLYFETNQKLSAIKTYKMLEKYIDNNLEWMRLKQKVAKLLIETNDNVGALEEYKNILDIYPEDEFTNKCLIELYKNNGSYEKAIELCEELLLINNQNKFSLLLLENLTEIYFTIKNMNKALEYANILLEHPFSDKLKTQEYIAKIHIANGEIDKSIELLQLLCENDNVNWQTKKQLADSFAVKHDFEMATSIYKEILDLVKPNEVNLIHTEMGNLFANWAMYLFEQQKYSECFNIFTLAIQYDNQNPVVYYKLGVANKMIKNFNEAILQFKRALDYDSKNPLYYMDLAECYKEIDNIYEEKNAILEAIKYDDSNANAHYRLALLYNGQHDVMNETASLRKAIELNSNFIDAKYNLALILEAEGNIDEAISLYEDIVELNPEHEAAQNNLRMLKQSADEDKVV